MTVFSKLLSGSRERIAASAVAAMLLVGGIAAITAGALAQDSSPNPGTAAAAPAPSSASRSTHQAPAGTSEPTAAEGPTLPPAEPTAIRIPAIEVSSSMFTVGQNPDGTIHVPQPGPNYDKAAWYQGSPMPGQLGPSVILGHIDSAAHGPSVFFRLGAMQPGQKVSVSRADGTVAVFTVDQVEQYDKDHFPTLKVYGITSRAELRLITCGGVFNEATGNYNSNIVVYAHLTGSR